MDAVLCSRCRGKGLCGRRCFILDKLKAIEAVTSKVGKDFFGSSPPSVFVGRQGYPKVNAGTLAPAIEGDTSDYDDPKDWFSKRLGMDKVLEYRGSLINSRSLVSVKKPLSAGFSSGIVEKLQEVAQAGKSVEIEAHYDRPIRPSLNVFSIAAPIGPQADLVSLDITENVRPGRHIDKAVSDTDMKAVEGISQLYGHGVDENRITKLLSIGLLGSGAQRRLVPTRWSITAVDDQVCKDLLTDIRSAPIGSEYRVFSAEYLGNHFEVIMIPREWSFEQIEVKFPGSVWNPGKKLLFMKDYENYYGRKDYAAEVAGGYYAGRLAVCEWMAREKKQYSALIFREVYDTYEAPLGVWVVRETMRSAMASKPRIFFSLKSAMEDASKRLRIPVAEFEKESRLLRESRTQSKLARFL